MKRINHCHTQQHDEAHMHKVEQKKPDPESAFHFYEAKNRQNKSLVNRGSMVIISGDYWLAEFPRGLENVANLHLGGDHTGISMCKYQSSWIF